MAKRGWILFTWSCLTDKACPADYGDRSCRSYPPLREFPRIGPPSQACALPSRAAVSGHRRSPVPTATPSGSPSPPGRSLGRELPGRVKPRAGQRVMLSAPLLSAAQLGRGRRWANTTPREAAAEGKGPAGRAGPRAEAGRRQCPRCALTQHEGAEALGHALGQVVHIELHGVQGQRLLHGDASTAAGRHPEPWQTPGRRKTEGKAQPRSVGPGTPTVR